MCRVQVKILLVRHTDSPILRTFYLKPMYFIDYCVKIVTSNSEDRKQDNLEVSVNYSLILIILLVFLRRFQKPEILAAADRTFDYNHRLFSIWIDWSSYLVLCEFLQFRIIIICIKFPLHCFLKSSNPL